MMLIRATIKNITVFLIIKLKEKQALIDGLSVTHQNGFLDLDWNILTCFTRDLKKNV